MQSIARYLIRPAFVLALFACFSGACQAKTISFAGYQWTVKSGTNLGPGPNDWSADNVWVDGQGALHLKLTHEAARWQSAQVMLTKRLGYGTYQFWLTGRIDRLDPNVVLGLFSYPTPDVGPDGTNEIDIEFAKWGRPPAQLGNYTVWPAAKGPLRANTRFPVMLNGSSTTHRYAWTPNSISFQSLYGHYDDNTNEFAHWTFQPPDPKTQIGHNPMPIEINLWLFKGLPPVDGQEVEMVVDSFKFTPAPN